MTIQQITFNLTPHVRHDMLEGREHVVVPMVMLTEGVHNGSAGALYYSATELAKTPQAWDHKPIVVYHPVINGQGISACSRDVLETQKVGIILNTKFEDGKLKAEAWIDKQKANKVDDRIMQAVGDGKMMELSTGLFTDNEPNEGVWNNEPYQFLAKNFRPDHLAILPDQIGACSIKDGAGFLRLNQEQIDSIVKDGFFKLDKETVQPLIVNFLNEERSAMKKKEIVDGLIANEATKWEEEDREFLNTLSEDQLDKMNPVESAEEEDDDEEDEDDPKPKPKAKGEEEEDDPKPAKTPKPKEPEPVQQQSADDYVNNAPPEIREVLQEGMRTREAEKARLIGTITANEQNQFSEKQLKAKPLEELRAIATLAAPKRQPDYSGAPSPLHNASSDDEPLVMPTMNFDNDE